MVRLTVRIPDDLYQRFAAFADGRTLHRGDTQLADSVRDALAHYLACPHKRMTKNSTVSSEDTREQTLNGTEDMSTYIQQTHNSTVPSMALELAEPLPLVHRNEPTEKHTESPLEPENGSTVLLRQTAKSTPPVPFDTADLEDMPLEPVDMPQQPAPPVPAVSPLAATLGDKAAVLAQLDAWKSTGLSLQKMADYLNAAQVPTFSGKGDWKKGTIGNLLAAQRQPAPGV